MINSVEKTKGSRFSILTWPVKTSRKGFLVLQAKTRNQAEKAAGNNKT